MTPSSRAATSLSTPRWGSSEFVLPFRVKQLIARAGIRQKAIILHRQRLHRDSFHGAKLVWRHDPVKPCSHIPLNSALGFVRVRPPVPRKTTDSAGRHPAASDNPPPSTAPSRQLSWPQTSLAP